MMLGNLSGRRREGEQVIKRRRHLERALVAVAHRAGDPFRVAGTAANNTPDFLAKGTDHRPLGKRMIIVIDRHITA